jgi:hypothetical protein
VKEGPRSGVAWIGRVRKTVNDEHCILSGCTPEAFGYIGMSHQTASLLGHGLACALNTPILPGFVRIAEWVSNVMLPFQRLSSGADILRGVV